MDPRREGGADAMDSHLHDDESLAPSPWLARAREEAWRLADQRAGVARPFLAPAAPTKVARAWRPTRAMAFAVLALALVCASGAWALVARGRRGGKTPKVAAPSVVVPATGRPAATRPTPTQAAAPQAVKPRPAPPPSPRGRPRSAARAAPQPASPAPTAVPAEAARPEVGAPELERPDVELIVVPRHPPQEPLFSPEEWRQQGPRGGR